MKMIWKRLSDVEKHWRHVHKVMLVVREYCFHTVFRLQSLLLLTHLAKTGAIVVVQEMKESMVTLQKLLGLLDGINENFRNIKTKLGFQYIEKGKDYGQNGELSYVCDIRCTL